MSAAFIHRPITVISFIICPRKNTPIRRPSKASAILPPTMQNAVYAAWKAPPCSAAGRLTQNKIMHFYPTSCTAQHACGFVKNRVQDHSKNPLKKYCVNFVKTCKSKFASWQKIFYVCFRCTKIRFFENQLKSRYLKKFFLILTPELKKLAYFS